MQLEFKKGRIYLIRENNGIIIEYKFEKVTEKCVLVRHRCTNKPGYWSRWYSKTQLLHNDDIIEEINYREEKLERICNENSI